MKKIARYLLITGCIVLFIFLLLPFLGLPTISDTPQQAALAPQIFTSNPLSEIARRIASAFDKQSTPASRPSAAPALQPDGETALAAAQTDETQTPDPDEENARFFFPNQEDDWVLVRQRVPEAAQSGMHEISAKDTAYERYIKQERIARFTPAAHSAQTQSVPDSKLARLFAPVKRFFGFTDSTPARSGALSANDTLASARSAGKGGSYGRDRTAGSSGTSSSRQGRTGAIPSSGSLTDWLNTSHSADDAADLVANSLPNADASTRARAREAQRQHYTDLAAERVRADLLERSGGETPQDVLPKTAECNIREGMITQDLCFNPPAEDIQAIRNNNLDFFEKQTGQPLPPTQLTPILGVADKVSANNLIPEEWDQEDPATLYTKEIYRFMLQQSDCERNNCFWVANTTQSQEAPYPTLEDVVTGAGVDFAGDPLQKYGALYDQFVQTQVAGYRQAHPEATPEETEKFSQDVRQAAPPYVLYTQADLNTLSQQVSNTPGQDNTARPALYFADAADALPFAQMYGYNQPIFYGTTGHKLVTSSQEIPLEQRSRGLTTDLISNLWVRQGIRQEIQQDASQTALKNSLGPAVRESRQRAAKELANFNPNFSLGSFQK